MNLIGSKIAVASLSLLSDTLKHSHAIGFWPIQIKGKSAGAFLSRVYSLTREGYESEVFP